MKKKFTLHAALYIMLIAVTQGIYAQNQSVIDQDEQFRCIANADFKELIKARIKKNIDSLTTAGSEALKDLPSYSHSVPLFWPLRITADYQSTSGVYDYYIITNYADIDRVELQQLDWMCNSDDDARNYDQHNGVDIAIQPFSWHSMDDEIADVIAAADGVVADIYDDLTFDRNNCDPVVLGPGSSYHGGYAGNYVVLMHADSIYTVYAHLKYGSVANLTIGESVQQGQFLGKVGSAGNSTGPHLHFEVDVSFDGIYVEPWWDASGCNYELSESWWATQKPYYDPALLRISTHDSQPQGKTCAQYEAGENEDLFLSNHFNDTDSMYIRIGIRDMLDGQSVSADILNSSGTIIDSYSFVADNYIGNSKVYFNQTLDGYADGQYRVRVFFNGKYYYHFFTVGCTDFYSLSSAVTGTKGWLAGDYITSTATVSGSSSNNLRYEAENYITLNPGFLVSSNANFTAKINACTIGGAKTTQQNTMLLNTSVNIYPNPTEGEFTIDLSGLPDESKSILLSIFDAAGKLVFQKHILSPGEPFTTNLSQYPKGIYNVLVQTEQQNISQRVILQ